MGMGRKKIQESSLQFFTAGKRRFAVCHALLLGENRREVGVEQQPKMQKGTAQAQGTHNNGIYRQSKEGGREERRRKVTKESRERGSRQCGEKTMLLLW